VVVTYLENLSLGGLGWDAMGTDPNDHRLSSRQIADELVDAIRRGQYRPGARFPSAREISEHYGVAAMTVNRALDFLKSANLIYSVQGRGTFVQPDIDPAKASIDERIGGSPNREVLERLDTLEDLVRQLKTQMGDVTKRLRDLEE
jgi:DNA-binding GntR family transcriptional regulator